MRKFTNISMIVSLLLLLCACGTPRKSATPPEDVLRSTAATGITTTGNPITASIEIIPSVAILEVGQTASVYVNVINISPLRGAEYHIVFDASKLEVIDTDPGIDGVQMAHGDFLSPDFVAQNNADNIRGVIDYAVVQMSSPDSEGSGLLSVITVRALQPGHANLSFVEAKMAATGGAAIPVQLVNASIQIGDDSDAIPESTSASETGSGETCIKTGDPSLSVLLEVDSFAVGETNRLHLVVKNGCDLKGAELHLTFDPSMIAVIDSDDSFPGIQAQTGILIRDANTNMNIVDNGEFKLGLTSSTAASKKTGILATLNIVALQNGETVVHIRDASLLIGTVVYTQDVADLTIQIE